jgi:hypothetical protein
VAKHKYIETPEDLLRMWNEYKDYRLKLYDALPVANNKTGEVLYLPVQKPLTRWSFEAYVFNTYGHHVKQYLDNQDNSYTAYLGVTTHIRNEWTDDHVSGTMTGKYKAPNLTARVASIGDKQDITTNGENINDIKVKIILPSDDSSAD